jgi:hypothetical protein
MRPFRIPTVLAILTVLPRISNAYYACSLSKSVPLSDLLPSSGSSGGPVGGSDITPASPGCSFYIAAGGSCTTNKPKDKVKRNDTGTNESAVDFGKRTYSTLPCLESMSCVTVNGQLGCFDLNTYDYIDDQGNCGNANTEESETGCVDKILGTQSSSATATGIRATGTASGSSSTSSSLSAKGGSSNSNGGARVATGFLLGLFVPVAGLSVV